MRGTPPQPAGPLLSVTRRKALGLKKIPTAGPYAGGYMRKLGIGVAIVCGIVVVIAAALAALFNPNKYSGAIQSELERRLDRKVILGDMHLGFFPPRFQADNVSTVLARLLGNSAKGSNFVTTSTNQFKYCRVQTQNCLNRAKNPIKGKK